MDEKKTYKEISFVLKQGRQDLPKCLGIIKKYGGEKENGVKSLHST